MLKNAMQTNVNAQKKTLSTQISTCLHERTGGPGCPLGPAGPGIPTAP